VHFKGKLNFINIKQKNPDWKEVTFFIKGAKMFNDFYFIFL